MKYSSSAGLIALWTSLVACADWFQSIRAFSWPLEHEKWSRNVWDMHKILFWLDLTHFLTILEDLWTIGKLRRRGLTWNMVATDQARIRHVFTDTDTQIHGSPDLYPYSYPCVSVSLIRAYPPNPCIFLIMKDWRMCSLRGHPGLLHSISLTLLIIIIRPLIPGSLVVEAWDLRNMTMAQTLLLGDENTLLHQAPGSGIGFGSATPQHQVAFTSNLLATPMYSSTTNISNTPRKGPTAVLGTLLRTPSAWQSQYEHCRRHIRNKEVLHPGVGTGALLCEL